MNTNRGVKWVETYLYIDIVKSVTITARSGSVYKLRVKDLVAEVENGDEGVVDKSKAVLTVEPVKPRVQFDPKVPEKHYLQRHNRGYTSLQLGPI